MKKMKRKLLTAALVLAIAGICAFAISEDSVLLRYFEAAEKLDATLQQRLLDAIASTSASKGAGFFVKIKGAVKYDVEYTNEEDFLAQKRELMLQGYKVDDKVTFYLDSKEALSADGHRLIIDKEWDYSCEYSKRSEAKEQFLKKVCHEIRHDDFATAPEDRF